MAISKKKNRGGFERFWKGAEAVCNRLLCCVETRGNVREHQ